MIIDEAMCHKFVPDSEYELITGYLPYVEGKEETYEF